MIYPEIRVPLPDMGGYTLTKGSVNYCYVYVGDPLPTGEGGKKTHPKSKCIGRIEAAADGTKELMPNTNYYDLTGKKQPDLAVREGVGRKPWHQKPLNADEMRKDSEIVMGYGLTIALLSAEIELTSTLINSFGESLGKKILCLGAFLCESMHSSLDGLDYFISKHLSGTNFDVTFDRRAAGQVLVEITPERVGAFFKLWNKAHPVTSELFYDVTSFSTYSGNIRRAHYGYNRDYEDLPQINQGLFCDRESGLPLFMCSYDGSLNDKSNFNNALRRAKEHGVGLGRGKRKICIVTDGGFSRDNVDWSHFLGYDVIIGVSCDYLKDVREAYQTWTKTITENERNTQSWSFDGSTYLSKSIPFKLGSVDGELMMYRDMTLENDKKGQIIKIRDDKKKELENTTVAPKDNFSVWANSYKPYFTVRKSPGRKGFVFEENTDDINNLCLLCGKVTLFVKRDYKKLSHQDTLKAYRSKESVEDCFDTTKNGLSDKRLHVHGDRQVDGKLFVMFVALILRRTLQKRLEQYLKEKDESSTSIIHELEEIKFYKASDGWHLKDSITKKQREILTALNLKIREDSQLNMNMLKQRVRKGRKTKLTPPDPSEPLDKVLQGTV